MDQPQVSPKRNKTLSVITGYQPCIYSDTQIDTPSNTIHRQQSIMLQSNGAKDTNPRRAFITDIIKYVNDLDDNPNNHTILMIDANEGTEDKEGGLRKLCNKTLLVDAFHLCTGEECEIATYSRGKKRINFIFASQQLIPYINHVGYLPFFEANDNGYQGLFMDVSNAILDEK
jgi:hypothetical protein